MRSYFAAFLLITTAPLAALWLNYPTPGIPRTPDGKPNLSAPAPRTADGKPDLSGIWDPDKYYLANANLGIAPGDVSYSLDGEQRRKQLTARGRACLPVGIPQLSGLPGCPFKILPSNGMIAILYEAFEVFRQIFLDGRQLPKDPNPTWLGSSVGRWDGDILVVDTDGFNDKGRLPGGGPHSEALHIIERFHRKDFGHMEIQFTIDDPKTYRKPWSFKEDQAMSGQEKRTRGRSSGDLSTINEHAAGLDVGSTFHVVAVRADQDEEPVRTFRSFSGDLHKMADWLTNVGITTVAMESTGVYWIPVFEILEARGFEVLLVNARNVKNVPGRKTDVNDAQWLQQLHQYGLLRGSFHPRTGVARLRTYLRLRERMVEYAAAHVQHMQKALMQMNVQLHRYAG